MSSCRSWRLALFLVLICLILGGCAEFLEDYQYNPAGPLYTSSSNH